MKLYRSSRKRGLRARIVRLHWTFGWALPY